MLKDKIIKYVQKITKPFEDIALGRTSYASPVLAENKYTKGFVYKLVGELHKDTRAVSGAILAGIMVMIIGFATLVIGNYIVYAIITSLPALNSTGYNSTLTTITTYATTVIPLFGLALMVLGFAIILFTLRSSMETGGSR
jgi:hypothetical protein